METIFTLALEFQSRYDLPEPPTTRGYLHDCLHNLLSIRPNLTGELLIRDVEDVLDGKDSTDLYAEYLVSTLPLEFRTQWTKHSI